MQGGQLGRFSYEEEAYFTYFVTRGKHGLAKIFHHVVKSDIKVVDIKKNDCYIWDDSECLWKERNCISAQNQVGNRLVSVFVAMETVFEEVLQANICQITEKLAKPGLTEFELAKLALMKKRLQKQQGSSPWTKLRPQVLKPRGMEAIFKHAKIMLFDGDFRESINQYITYFMPVTNCKVVDLRSGTVGPRHREHRFTFECIRMPAEEQHDAVVPDVTQAENDVARQARRHALERNVQRCARLIENARLRIDMNELQIGSYKNDLFRFHNEIERQFRNITPKKDDDVARPARRHARECNATAAPPGGGGFGNEDHAPQAMPNVQVSHPW
jgi:hypothetical protein